MSIGCSGDRPMLPEGRDASVVFAEGPLRLKRCRYGPMLFLETDEYIGRSLDLYGEFSQGELDLLEPLVPPGATVIDIGAHVGAHTLGFARKAGTAGLVLAFEPQRALHQILCANLALGSLRHVHAHHAAAGRRDGAIRVPVLDTTQPGNFGGLSLVDRPPGEDVPLLRIDDLDLSRLDLMKVDVEGMEGEVVAGAESAIRRHHPALYIENDRAESSEALIESLLALDYRLYWHLPPLFNPGNWFGNPENVFGGIVSANMLGLHVASPHRVEGLRPVLSPEDSWQGGLAIAE
jgi:FkbM family methyltransferase